MMNALRRMSGLVIAMVLIAFLTTTLVAQTTTQDPLVQVLVQKGVLTSGDAKTVTGNPQEQRDRLAQILREKGVLSATDLNSVRGSMPAGTFLPVAYTEQAKPMAPGDARPAAPSVIPAVAPVRVLQLEPAKPGGLIPDLKLGSGARLKLYGFLKASTVYDTSSPEGNDFPLPGFRADTGPEGSPEFHMKARASRFGANFEWPDISPKVAVTGKIEFDFEGNFARSASMNASSLRNSAPRIRLAWGRVDYKATDRTSLFALFGEDWTPFASSTMPNMLETTILGAFYGNIYNRATQFRVGMDHKFGGFHFAPEFAISMPQFGAIPTAGATQPALFATIPSTCVTGTVTCFVTITPGPGGLSNQLAYGERVGSDSGRPEIQGRLVFQWQLDHAKGVAPAQIIVSGIQGKRTSMLTAALIPCDDGRLISVEAGCTATGSGTTIRTAFPKGTTVDESRWGYTAEAQLPTRYVTVVGKYYRGEDLNIFTGGQGLSTYNNTNAFGGMLPIVASSKFITASNVDAATTVAFGINPLTGLVTTVPQNPVRNQGGFAQVSFPLSRIFNADPAGRNAGWTIAGTLGMDQAFAKDVVKAAPTNPRNKSYMAVATLMYKMNQFVTFGLEESYYGSSELTGISGYGTVMPGTTLAGTGVQGVGSGAIFRGIPAARWHDFRSEFATIFTF